MIWSAIACLPRLVRFIRRLAPSAIYVNTVTLPWWLLVSRLTRTPTICHLHEAENTDGGLVRRALIMPLHFAHAVIVISQSAMSAMVDTDRGLERQGTPDLQRGAAASAGAATGPSRRNRASSRGRPTVAAQGSPCGAGGCWPTSR